MRILLLTQWFEPEPAFKGLTFAKALRDRGHAVEVLTGFPNYPGGNVYPGYRIRVVQNECIDGIHVTRVPLYPSHNQSTMGRVLNYSSFALSSCAFGSILARRPDVLYVYHPPGTVGLIALVLRSFRRIPVLYDVQDLWPDTLAATGMIRSKTMLSVIGAFCKMVYRAADAITVLSPGFKRRLVQLGVSEEKIKVIYNWAPEHENGSEKPELGDTKGKFLVVFAGNIGLAQGLDTVLDAAKMPNLQPHVRFLLIGTGLDAERLKHRAISEGISNVTFLPRVPGPQIAAIYQRADALLVHLKRDPLFEITIPSKTQAYLAAGQPVLMGVSGDAADLVEQARAGLVFRSEDTVSLAASVNTIAQMSPLQREQMGNRGRQFYHEHLRMDLGVMAFERELQLLANRTPTRKKQSPICPIVAATAAPK